MTGLRAHQPEPEPEPEPAAGPESSGRDLYRLADLEVFRAGDGMSLVYSRDSGAAGFYRSDVLSLLASCREFRTLDEHAREYLTQAATGASAPALRRELYRLSEAGFLISAGLGRPGADDGPDHGSAMLPPLSTIVVPTKDRVPLLARMISGYAENCRRHGRRPTFVVADDSPALATRLKCQSMLRQLSQRFDAEISYAGWEQKCAFVSRLADTRKIPEEVIRFGCLPGDGSRISVGANRNVLLLHTLGERILSADDDTVCQVAIPPGFSDGIDLDSGGNPLELWFFRERDEALAAVRYVEEDILARHGHYLGASPAAVLAGTGPASLKRSDPALLRGVRSAAGRIRVTVNGVVGDCGWDNPDFHLFQTGPTFDRLVGSSGSFRVARATREMVQAVTRTTITARADPKFAMCIGLDNTALLPPFPPVGRAEEVAFGAILTACSGHVYTAHLPMLVQHDPVTRKVFADGGPFVINPGSWLQSCISQFDSGLTSSPAERLDRLGHFLTDLGRLPEGAFDEFARLAAWHSMSGLIGGLEDKLSALRPPSAGWAREARQFIARARRSALAPAQDWYAAAGGRRELQRLLEQFGQLLIWWPAIVGTARELRAVGDRPAFPVHELGGAA